MEASVAASKPILTKAYQFANGMVMAFDQNGQQMPEYQGSLDEVQAKILADYPAVKITEMI